MRFIIKLSDTMTVGIEQFHHLFFTVGYFHYVSPSQLDIRFVTRAFFARATEGTSLYVSLCQSVFPSVIAFLFFGGATRSRTV